MVNSRAGLYCDAQGGGSLHVLDTIIVIGFGAVATALALLVGSGDRYADGLSKT